MILERLIVERYGHFERLELDLGAGRGGLTVIAGANEAGKSTLLQGIRDLFFGIDHQTPLAFRFDYKSILLRAKLRDSAGQRLEIERRKKRKNSLRGTLSSQAGVVDDIDDARFAAYFGGVKADLYNALFGFSLDDLQRGAGALEEAGLKEILGGSALGAAGDRIAAVLGALRKEGRDLYKTQGKIPPINRGLSQLKETQLALRDATLQQSAYQGLVSRLEAIRKEIDAADARLADLRQRRGRGLLLVRAAADLRELAEVERTLERGGGELTEDEARRAQRALTEAAAARPRLHSLDAEIEHLEGRIAALAVDDALLREAAAIDRLSRRLDHLAALRREIPGERAALTAATAKIQGEARELGLDAGAGEAGASAALVDRLRQRTRRWREAHDEVAQAVRADQQQRADIEAARAILGRHQDDAEDRETLFLAAELEELGERRSQLDRVVADGQRYEVEIMAALAPFGARVEPAAAADLESPPEADLGELLAAHAELDDRRRRIAAERERLAAVEAAREAAAVKATATTRRSAKETAARDALSRIADARARRGSAWEELRQAWLTGPERLTELERYGLLRAVEAAIDAADEAADHLKDHADQLARLRAADLAVESNAAVQAELERGAAELEEDRERWRRSWERLWERLPCCPAPADARPLLRALDSAREAAIRLQSARRREEDLRPPLVDFEARLRRHLGQERAGWPLLVKLLRERAAEAQTRRGRRESTRERLASIEAARELSQGLLDQAKRSEATLRAELRALLEELGLDPETAADEALRRIERRAELRDQEAILDQRREALAGKEAALDEVLREAAALLGRLGLGDDERPLAAAVEDLARRLTAARGNDLARRHAEQTLGQRRPLRERAAKELAAIEAALADLRQRCAAADDPALADAADRALRRDVLRARQAELRRRVAEHVADAGRPREALAAELAGCDLPTLRDDLAALEPALADLERRRTALAEQKGKLDQEIESLGGDTAARLGADTQTLLADLGENVDRYVLVHVAHRILDAVTERFARESQPAILQQISHLLAKITGGRHPKVSADRQRGTLLVHDAHGQTREPKELSTGTREQLFLALRLAYVLDYCDRAEPLPVIIDDVLVNFDQGRARRSLEALCEVSRATQVLLFTCHQHIVDLTRAVAPEAPIFELPTINAGSAAVDAVTLRLDPASNQTSGRSG
ncbi:MAG: AAA family ATPase [Nannocystaceae bacterium]